jgi:hypothetical protein
VCSPATFGFKNCDINFADPLSHPAKARTRQLQWGASYSVASPGVNLAKG